MSDTNSMVGRPWTDAEVAATVADYFQMLRLDLSGQQFNKSAHRRELKKRLLGRSESAIEMKHRNISAIMLELGSPPLRGYASLPNYQLQLYDAVATHLAADVAFDKAAMSAVEQPAEAPPKPEFSQFVVDRPPSKPVPLAEQAATYPPPRIIKRDYLEREARNQALGLAGEMLALRYEEERLTAIGRSDLASRIEHVSATSGDGCGFDILSFDETGEERFIEVKTTAFAIEMPFFVSQNEVKFSETNAPKFCLYRLFNFRRDPRMFTLPGAIAASCLLDPASYRARPI